MGNGDVNVLVLEPTNVTLPMCIPGQRISIVYDDV